MAPARVPDQPPGPSLRLGHTRRPAGIGACGPGRFSGLRREWAQRGPCSSIVTCPVPPTWAPPRVPPGPCPAHGYALGRHPPGAARAFAQGAPRVSRRRARWWPERVRPGADTPDLRPQPGRSEADGNRILLRVAPREGRGEGHVLDDALAADGSSGGFAGFGPGREGAVCPLARPCCG